MRLYSNSTTAGVMGKTKISLKLTSGKTSILNNVLYIPSLRRNLVFGAFLNKVGLKFNFKADKIMNSMLLSSNLPDYMWGEVVLSACYILNRVPHEKLDKTLYELWKEFAPNLKFLKVWGCLTKIDLPDFRWVNVGSKTFDTAFIGYAQNSVAYRFMSINDYSICEYRDAEFFFSIFFL